LTKTIGDWKWDSFNSIISNLPTQLKREELLELFGGRDELTKFHQRSVAFNTKDWIEM
jgi:hypothetical protein